MNLSAPYFPIQIDKTDTWNFLVELFDINTEQRLDFTAYQQISAFIFSGNQLIHTLKLNQGLTIEGQLLRVIYNPITIVNGVPDPSIETVAESIFTIQIIGTTNNINVTLIKLILDNTSNGDSDLNQIISAKIQNNRVVQIETTSLESLFNNSAIKYWEKRFYPVGSSCEYAGYNWTNITDTQSTDEPGISPLWVQKEKSIQPLKKTLPFQVSLNLNKMYGFTEFVQNSVIDALQIVIEGNNKYVDCIKIPLECKATECTLRLYEGDRVILIKKITTIKDLRKIYYIELDYSVYFKAGLRYKIEIESSNYLGFSSCFKAQNFFFECNYRFLNNPTWYPAFDSNYGIGFELLTSAESNDSTMTEKGLIRIGKPNGFFAGVNDFSGWGIGIDFTEDTIVNEIVFRLDRVAYNEKILIRLNKRAKTDISLINESNTEIFLLEKEFPTSIFQNHNGEQNCRFDLGKSLSFTPNEVLIVELVPLRKVTINNEEKYTNGSIGISNYGNVSAERTTLFCYKMGSTVKYGYVNDTHIHPVFSLIGSAKSSKNYAISQNLLAFLDSNQQYREITIPETTVVYEEITNFRVPLEPDNSTVFWQQLRNNVGTNGQAIINIVDINVNGKQEGVHYQIDRGSGRIRAIGAAFTTNIQVTFANERRDFVVSDLNNQLSIVSAQEHRTSALEYFPVLNGIYSKLFSIITRKNAIYVVDDSKRIAFESFVINQQIIQAMQFWKKLESGGVLRIGSYGDSITAQQRGVNPGFNPNGPDRDVIEYLWGIFTDDYLGTIPLFDGHTHIGWAWQLIEFLKKKYPGQIEYYNFGIAGTNSSDSVNNGRYPARLQAIESFDLDLVLLGFGMNEIGSDSTYWNICDIINHLTQSNKDVIVLDCPKPSGYSTWWNEESWMKTNTHLKLAAQHKGVGYCSFSDFLKNGWEFADKYGRCRQNNWNHPSRKELENYGKMIVEYFK